MKIFSSILKLLLLGSLFIGVSVFAYETDAFVIKVNTENVGSEDYIFRIPTHPDYAGSYNYTINCDVTGELPGEWTYVVSNITGDGSCTYSLTDGDGNTTYYPDIYTIAITGDFPAIYFNNTGDKEKIVEVMQWGTEKWKTMNSAFRGAVNLTVSASDNPDLSELTSLAKMFRGASSLRFTHPINDWDVSNVTEMDYMFFYAESFNKDIGAWDVSKVTTMYFMFSYAREFNQDIGDWDLSSIREMRSMFLGADTFNQDISSWNLSTIITTASFEIKLSHLSISNYDNLLIKWNQLDLLDNVEFYAGTSKYCKGVSPRAHLIQDEGWTFHDGGEDCEFYITTANEITVASEQQAVLMVETTYDIDYSYYSIKNVADGDKFSINDDGDLRFKNPPNGNNPSDNNRDNIYRVQVEAFDDMGTVVDYQTIKVTVEADGNPALVPTIMYLLN